MSNITEEQKAEFLKYYPDHEDKLEEIIEDDRIFCFYDVKFDPNKSTLEKVDYLNPMGIYSNLVCYIE